jgi:hypothetical protein
MNTTQSVHDHHISFLPGIFCTSARINVKFLRLLFYHAHWESKEFLCHTGQLEQPNQDSVFSKRAAFFNSLKSNAGHIIAKATSPQVTSILPLLSPLFCAPLHEALTSSSSIPLTSTTTSVPPMVHERATSTLFKVVAFVSRSFSTWLLYLLQPLPTIFFSLCPP